MKPTDNILDIGCGDGALTIKLAEAAHKGHVMGLDASASMIETAKNLYPVEKPPFPEFHLQDCTRLSQSPQSIQERLVGSWDKVFSNAALHWILRNPETRMDVFRDIHSALRPDGIFVFEMGGAGNVGEVNAALVGGLMAHGVAAVDARNANPWFFPDEIWMRKALETTGFEVERLELEYRPTQLTADSEGGITGWIKLMGADFLEQVRESERQEVIKWACAALEDIITREDGSKWIGYVRLRGVAKKRNTSL